MDTQDKLDTIKALIEEAQKEELFCRSSYSVYDSYWEESSNHEQIKKVVEILKKIKAEVMDKKLP